MGEPWNASLESDVGTCAHRYNNHVVVVITMLTSHGLIYKFPMSYFDRLVKYVYPIHMTVPSSYHTSNAVHCKVMHSNWKTNLQHHLMQ